MNLDKFSADIIEALLKDLGDTFPVLAAPMGYIEADLYGWRVARAEDLADAMKGLATKLRVLEVEADIPAGMMRSLFAMNAPPVPDWWPAADIKTEYGPYPPESWPRAKVEEYSGLGDWLEEKDLKAKWRDDILAFRDEYNATIKRRDQERLAVRLRRECEWRWAYADAMLAARNPEPKPAIVETQK